MGGFDWDASAAVAAEKIGETMMDAHRGAVNWGAVGGTMAGVVVAFGNDGYRGDERARAEVENFRGHLGHHGIPILGFGVDRRDGYTWAMIVRHDDPSLIHTLVWSAADDAGFACLDVQAKIATGVVLREQGSSGPGGNSMN